jgi:hypothetical protein
LEDWKIKISVLWLFYTIAFVTILSLGALEPSVLEHFLSTGEIGGIKITPELLFVFAILILVPLIMAFLSLTLKDAANRWANIIVGIVYTALQIVSLAEAIAVPTPYAYAILLELTKVVVPALVVWYAWKSKQKT